MYSRKFQIIVENKQAPSFDLPFGTFMTKLNLFHEVERKMDHARQTFEIAFSLPVRVDRTEHTPLHLLVFSVEDEFLSCAQRRHHKFFKLLLDAFDALPFQRAV